MSEPPVAEPPRGYKHPAYAASLAEFGTPRALVRSGGWLLERPITGTNQRDAMGCYPLFACPNWSQLHLDLEDIGEDLVSVSLVTDPFGEYTEEYLSQCFSDRVTPFKDHLIVDLQRSPGSFVDAHHRRNARKALENIRVEICSDPERFADEWTSLYDGLISRHDIRGVSAFSRASFAAQLAVPGMVMLRATQEGEVVGMTLWYAEPDVAYYHLGAYTETGYKQRASFALFWQAIEYFADRGMAWLNLGAGAGLKGDAEDGLTRFKRGWSTGTRTAYLCGKIFNHELYAEIVRSKQVAATDYFPAYRKGEFG